MVSKTLKRSRGFTLFEAFAVMAVVGIMAAVSVKPMLGLVKKIKLQNAADGVKHTILNARVRAMSNSYRHCGIVIRVHGSTTVNDTIFAFFDKPPYNSTNTGWNVYNAGIDSLYGQPFVIDTKKNKITTIIPSPFDDEIIFKGDGSANVSGALVLTLGNFEDTVKVIASTGKVKVVHK